MSEREICLRAKWILPVDGAPIENGRIVVRNGRIQSLASVPAQASEHDLGNAIVFPQFINAHTHLEFSYLSRPLSESQTSFASWIRNVIAERRNLSDDARVAQKLLAVQTGLSESRSAAVAALGEIVSWPDCIDSYQQANPACVVFHERLGLAAASIAPTIASLDESLTKNVVANAKYRPGISPHSPYSTHFELVRQLVALANRREIPVAMHLAESREELELLATGHGPLRQMLDELEVWQSDAIPRGIQVLDYLRLLATNPRSLIIHGNYLSESEMDFIAANRQRMTVVFCPRTHSFFGHERYPLQALLQRGITVAMGTDSRASNLDLRVAREIEYAARQFPDVAPKMFLRMATLNSAQALGLENELGAIAPGKLAKLAIIDLPNGSGGDPLRLWLEHIDKSRSL